MMWVKLTLPPRERRRWLLITMRLSFSAFTGTARTLVAVGMERLASMLVAVRAAAPRRGFTVGPPESAGLASPGLRTGSAGVGRVVAAGEAAAVFVGAAFAGAVFAGAGAGFL